MDCYRFEKRTFDKGFLDDAIDATFIIHLDGNGRLEHINYELTKYHPSKTVYILFNKGYKNCVKPTHVQNPPSDLVDAYMTIMKYAEKKNYKNILILEDDFIFDEQVLNVEHAKHISEFVNSNDNSSFVYLLGCLPIIQVPISYYTRYTPINASTHAVIYSEACRKNLLTINHNIGDWDLFLTTHFTQYMYYKPLCYQLFPVTENQKHWPYFMGITELAFLYFYIFDMDKTPYPGFTNLYTFSFLFFFMILLFLFIFIKQLHRRYSSEYFV